MSFLSPAFELERFQLRIAVTRNRIRGRSEQRSKGVSEMKYILMMHILKSEYEVFGASSQEDIQATVASIRNLNEALGDSGEFVAADGLAMPDQAKVVKASKDGMLITHGVFPESKEFLAGYLMVDVETTERAYEIAATWSAAPGPDGVPLNLPIEVRQAMTAASSELP
jgi:hypothetical protein